MKLRASFVHSHRAPIEHRSIQRSNSCLGLRRLPHLDESDTAGFARIPVLDNRDGFDRSVCREDISELQLCHRDIEVPNKNVSHALILPLIFPKALQLTRAQISKGDLGRYHPFARSRGLRVAARFQLASPWGPSSHRTARFGPPEGS